jgi:hexosaminidase
MWLGAFSDQERYTIRDVKEIIESALRGLNSPFDRYAALRGIRVMPEFDMPGHAASWCAGYPDACPSTSCPEPLDPSSNVTWTVVESVLTEMSGPHGVFFDEMVHLGGDEVDMGCWNQSDRILGWLGQRNMSLQDGYKYFVDRAHQMALDLGKTPVNWEGVALQF